MSKAISCKSGGDKGKNTIPFLIQLDRVSISLNGIPVLENTSWTLQKHQNWLVTGPNGSGKTTLLKALAGKVPICSGRYRSNFHQPLSKAVCMISPATENAILDREAIGDLQRDFSGTLSEGTSVLQYLRSFNPGLSVKELLEFPIIDSLMNQHLRSLSTGEIKMVMVAAAFLSNPELLLLDEPFDGLDKKTGTGLASLLETYADTGCSLVLTAHRFDLIPDIFTHRIHLKNLQIDSIGAIDIPLDPTIRISPLTKVKKNVQQPVDRAESEKEQIHPDTLAKLVNVTVRYGGKKALSNLSWELKKGENWIIKGPNGSGKSTLAALLYADHPQAYSNCIILFGKRRGTGESIWQIKQNIGFVSNSLQREFQIDITVLNAVISGFYDSKGLFRKPDPEKINTARLCLESLGLSSWQSRNFKTLSTGEQRMVLITRSLVKNPLILILDEICSGLDISNRKKILAFLERIGSSQNLALVYITHHEDEIPACMDSVLELPGAMQYRL